MSVMCNVLGSEQLGLLKTSTCKCCHQSSILMRPCICRFQQDTLLGVASIPLSPLLQESWVQGTAPVLAMMTKPDSQSQERVQV